MKDLDKLFRCLEEHIDSMIDRDFDSFSKELFDRDAFYEEIKELFGKGMFDEAAERPDDEYCEAVFKTLCRTICFCREMEEIEVPEDIHTKLLRALEEELED